jgi:hypothetical protein
MVAAGPQMSGNPLTVQKDLDGSRRQPHLDLASGRPSVTPKKNHNAHGAWLMCDHD